MPACEAIIGENLIQQQAASGQPVTAFCAHLGLTERWLNYWKKRLNKEVSFALVTTGGSRGKQAVCTLGIDM